MRASAGVFFSSQADAPWYRSYGLDRSIASRARGMDTTILTATATDSRIGANQLRGEPPVETGSGCGVKRGVHAKAAKISAKGGKYSTKRRAWKSISPKSNEASRLNAIRTSIFLPERPSANAPLAKATSEGSEFSRSCLVS